MTHSRVGQEGWTRACRLTGFAFLLHGFTLALLSRAEFPTNLFILHDFTWQAGSRELTWRETLGSCRPKLARKLNASLRFALMPWSFLTASKKPFKGISTWLYKVSASLGILTFEVITCHDLRLICEQMDSINLNTVIYPVIIFFIPL